jgi:hypothetical protein
MGKVLDLAPQVVSGLWARRVGVPRVLAHWDHRLGGGGCRRAAGQNFDHEEERRDEGLQPPKECLLPDLGELVFRPHHTDRVRDPEWHGAESPDDGHGDASGFCEDRA